MKKIVSYVGMLLGAALILSSCGENLGGTITPTDEHQIVIRASEGVNTRTYIDGASVKWTSGVEQLRVFEVATPTAGDPVSSKVVSSVGVSEDGGQTMSFGVTLEGKDAAENDFDYYAFYPSSAYQTGQAGNDATSISINTQAVQTPTATSFDPAADLLIAEGITGEDSQPANLDMRFTRMISVGKMTIKNLESTDPIKRITFSAKVGDTPVVLAGRTTYDLTTATVKSSYGNNVPESSIILDYSALNLTANTAEGMTAFFTCYPFALNSVTPGSFKVIVETATEAFTKEVNVSSAKGLAFNVGKASTFSVEMDGISGVTKAVDLRYAFLSYDDYDKTPGTSASYATVTVTKSHGDAWETSALKNSGGIQINTGHYIKLPEFVENIKTVIVTLSATNSGKDLKLESTSTGEEDDIASTTMTSSLTYEFDLSSDTKKTAYLLSTGSIKISKIEVYSGTDNRTSLTTPTSVTAVRNTDDDDITNRIDVSWSSVSGAIGYEVTLTPSEGDAVIQSTASTTYSFEDLEYSTTYTPSVVAIADPYLNFNSLAGTGAAAATAAAPSNILSLVSSTLSSYDANAYGVLQSITSGDYTWKHTGYKKYDSDGYIQLRKKESPYIELPLTPGTINKVVLSVTSTADAATEGDPSNKCKGNLTFSCLDYSTTSSIDAENGVNEITLTPTALTYRNGRITAPDAAVKIWSIRVYYTPDEATLSSLTITTPATKTAYIKDEAIVFDGQVRGNYSNSSIADITSLVSVTGSTASVGSTDVTVSYGGKSTTYAITVAAAPSGGIAPVEGTCFNLTSYASIPSGWSSSSVTTESYFKIDAGGYLQSPAYNISGCATATVSVKVAKYGSGTDPAAVIYVSYDGGSNWTESKTLTAPSSSTYLSPQTLSLSKSFTNNVVIKIVNPAGNASLRVQSFSFTVTD